MPPWRYGATADDVIHPGVARDVACLTRENNMTPMAPEGALITYAIACEGLQLIEGTHLVTDGGSAVRLEAAVREG